MIENGSDVHQGADGPLMRAALNGDRIPMMELLVSHGADVNAKDTWHGGSVLRWARAGWDGALSRWVREHGAVMDIFEACEAADLRRVKELLEANPSLVNPNGDNPAPEMPPTDVGPPPPEEPEPSPEPPQ